MKENKADILLEVAFDLAEKSVHLDILLLVKLLPDPGQTGQNHIHKPVRPNLRMQTRLLTKSHHCHLNINQDYSQNQLKIMLL